MASAVETVSDSFLSLSASDLRELLPDWPEAMIEDYLSILRNLLSLATIIDVDIGGDVSANTALISKAMGSLASFQKDIRDIEGTDSTNSGLIFQAIGSLMDLRDNLADSEELASADNSNSLVTAYSIFSAPPAVGNVRMSSGFFKNGGTTNKPRSDIASINPTWQVEGVEDTALSVVQNSNDANGPDLILGKSRSTDNGGTTIVQNGDLLGRLLFVAADGSDLDTISGAITLLVDDSSPSAGSVGATMRLQVMTTAGSLLTGIKVNSSLAHDYTIGDNLAGAWAVSDAGSNNYFQVATTNGSEVINFGNTTTNPNFVFLGSGIISGSLQDNSAILIRSGATLTDASGVAAGTLTNAPTAGDPSKWCTFDDNGTVRKFPTWT